MITAELVAAGISVLMRLPRSHVDVEIGESQEERLARIAHVVHAAALVAHTVEDFSAELAYGQLDTHYAKYVYEGHCNRMPKGERCDGGHARGVWSVHGWCKAAYAYPAGSDESLLEEARCALRQMHFGMAHCRAHSLTPLHGGFAALAAAPCSWAGADRRVQLAHRIQAMLAAPPSDAALVASVAVESATLTVTRP
jgi:hypothetical protein